MTLLPPAFPSPRYAKAPSQRCPVPESGSDQVVDSLDAAGGGAVDSRFRRKATGDGRNDGLASGFFGVVGIPSRRILRRFAQRPANRNTGPVQTSPTASAVNGRTAGKTAGVRKRGSGVRHYQGHGMAYNPAAMRTIARGGHGAQACNRSLATGAGVNPARVHLTAFSLKAVRPGCDTGTGRTPPGTPFPIGGTAPTPNPRRDER